MIYEYTTIDKSEWSRGPWDDEPDKRQWFDESTGLWCLILRPVHTGNLCGYVAFPMTEPVQQVSQDELIVHGGLTFAGTAPGFPTFVKWQKFRDAMFKQRGTVRRYPQGDDARNWKLYGRFMDDWQGWIEHQIQSTLLLEDVDVPAVIYGFDCGHAGDISPALKSLMARHEGMSSFDPLSEVYRTIEYVTAECESLAQQLSKEFPDGRRFDRPVPA